MKREEYDAATLQHIASVARLLHHVADELLLRAWRHDASKMSEPEASILAGLPDMTKMTYGSEAYMKVLLEAKPALAHHYDVNRHHPEFHDAGILGMNLVDLAEMMCDWIAATRRHGDGDIIKSLEINQQRFGYSNALKQILLNTVVFLLDAENGEKEEKVGNANT